MHPEVLDTMREIERRNLAVLTANESALLMRPVYEDLGEEAQLRELYQGLLGLKPQPQAQGRWIRFVADFKQAERRGQLSDADVLVVDESSMLSEQLGSDLTKLAATTGTVVICVGDASQLPPVDPPPEPGDEDEGSNYRGVMAEAFLDPPAA